MSSSVFVDKAIPPNDKMLASAPGKSYSLWVEIKGYIQAEYGDLVEEWRHYGQKSGRILKSLNKKRKGLGTAPSRSETVAMWST